MRFIGARNYTRTAIDREVRLLVVHSMETTERPRIAEDIALSWAREDSPEASCHFLVDANEAIQAVRLNDVAWHARGSNDNSVGIEHAGRASQTDAEWRDDYSMAVLRRSALVAAFVCRRYTLPVLFVGERGLLQGLRGVTTHAAISAAFRKSNHHDPGPGFPMELYLSLVAEALQSVTLASELGEVA